MDRNRWQQIEALYHAALERESGAREGFLAQACGADEELRREVEELLRYDGAAESFIKGNALAFEARRLKPEELSQTAPQLLPGQHIGTYKILSLLGRGGMGVVYRARDERLRRDVAVKVLPASLATDADRLRRFEQEAHATSALNHPNILTIYDIGAHEGAPFIVAELLEGEELRAQLNSGALPVRRALEYAQQITQGLAAAHEKGIVHRDLKPENLFVTKDGRVKILDFGLAKLKPPQAGAADTDAPTQKRLTDPGVVMGTVGYMSPEQVRGQETDHRSDIFAFGVILYEMLSGQQAFRGASAIEVMNTILKEEPPELGVVNTKIGLQLEKLVRRCLEKQPERRFQTASDLGFALESLSTSSGSRPESLLVTTASPAVETGDKRPLHGAREKWYLAATALAMLMAVVFAWGYFTRRPAPDAQLMKLSLLPPDKTSFGQIAVSYDGRWLAFTGATGGKVQLWARSLATGETKLLEGSDGATSPFWSPDSRFIGFFSGGKLKKVEVSGGLPSTLCDVGVAIGGAWNRGGVILFSSLGATGISRVPAAGGAPTTLLRPDLKRKESDYYVPSFLPDGRHFLYFVNSSDKDTRGIYLGSLEGDVRRRLLGDASNAIYAASDTDGSGKGYLLFGREGALMAQPFDTAAMQLGGEAISVAPQVGMNLGLSYSIRLWNFSVSDNGMLIFDPRPNRQHNQLLWVDRGGRIINSLEGLDNTGTARLAPDDRRFAVARFSLQVNNNDIWLSDVTDHNAVPFTFDPGTDQHPVWSPDGSRIVWASNRNGRFNLYEKAASLAGGDALLLRSDNHILPTDWSRDGRYIIYRQIDPKPIGTKYDIWALPLFGERKPFPLLQTDANEAAAVVSPDGRWLAYCSDETGRYEVYVQNFPGGGGMQRVSTGGGIGPLWRGDGNELYYHAPDGKLMAAPVAGGTSLAVGVPTAQFEFRAGGNLIVPYYSVTRDGKRFLLSTIVETEKNAPLTVVVNWTAGVKK
jgi:serine/threonine protein kinase/Tol biopolymer transport system component